MSTPATSTVGRFARAHGLARSTLLYYDRIGLLRPSGRSPAGYRLYTDGDAARLQKIRTYRAIGLGMREIRRVLASPADTTREILEARLDALNHEIDALREQQRIIASLLSQRGRWRAKSKAMDKESWVALLRASGLSDEAMHRWHVEFERRAPEAHADFLASLGIAPAESSRIRAWAKKGARA